MLKLVMNFFKVLGLGVIGLFIILILIVSCSKDEPTVTKYESEETPSTAEEVKVEVVQNNAKLTNLGSGTFQVGVDIPDGRYIVKAVQGDGNFFVEGDDNFVNEMLGSGEPYVNNITVTLHIGDKVEISGINKVTFTPKK